MKRARKDAGSWAPAARKEGRERGDSKALTRLNLEVKGSGQMRKTDGGPMARTVGLAAIGYASRRRRHVGV